MSKTTILITVLAILFLIAVAVALQHLGTAGKREVVNRYNGSEFSFTYPLGLELEEYGNGSIAIGSTTQNGFSSAVDLTVVQPSGDTVPADFMAFIREQVLNLCAADGPGERISCSTVESEAKVETPGGENPIAYYVTLVREVAGQEPETKTFGPIYAYIVTTDDEGEDVAPKFSALLVHNPLPAVVAGTEDTTLLTRINDSVTRGPASKK